MTLAPEGDLAGEAEASDERLQLGTDAAVADDPELQRGNARQGQRDRFDEGGQVFNVARRPMKSSVKPDLAGQPEEPGCVRSMEPAPL